MNGPDIANNIIAGNVNLFNDPETFGLQIDDTNPLDLEGNLLHQNLPGNLGIDGIPEALPDGSDNLAADPRFQDAPAGNYRLWPDSPAVEIRPSPSWSGS